MVRGVTLIETLLVIALLGLLAGFATVGLSGAGERSRVLEARSAVFELDGRARQLASRENGARLVRSDGVLTLHAGNNDRNAVSYRRMPAPLDVRVRPQSGGSPLDEVVFDSRGRCPDYEFEVVRARDASIVERWRVSGLTGWAERVP
ncbi:MAG: prepilin-type N-terminal cleavage/methylation domain-containing protein [Planctomycetota bacterium]